MAPTGPLRRRRPGCRRCGSRPVPAPAEEVPQRGEVRGRVVVVDVVARAAGISAQLQQRLPRRHLGAGGGRQEVRIGCRASPAPGSAGPRRSAHRSIVPGRVADRGGPAAMPSMSNFQPSRPSGNRRSVCSTGTRSAASADAGAHAAPVAPRRLASAVESAQALRVISRRIRCGPAGASTSRADVLDDQPRPARGAAPRRRSRSVPPMEWPTSANRSRPSVVDQRSTSET